MKNILIFLLILIFNSYVNAKKICNPKIIKTEKEIIEKLKICNKGDKLLLYFDIKLKTEDLVVKLCDLKHTIITKEDNSIIHKRGSGMTIICIYDPT